MQTLWYHLPANKKQEDTIMDKLVCFLKTLLCIDLGGHLLDLVVALIF